MLQVELWMVINALWAVINALGGDFHTSCLEELKWLTKVPRFQVAVMFLSKDCECIMRSFSLVPRTYFYSKVSAQDKK